ncbi:hypothetical protein HPB48_011168 [Haemaphysalis longicornis]|uniref:Uncharacterized protein n=1 Tax=Haemaphysalis longicornis TaxID=44386 RepID=A0A9J6GZ28_HAELO|nr:hypothetical protein HPB48_011168 [Haemaphysalis longicornis]
MKARGAVAYCPPPADSALPKLHKPGVPMDPVVDFTRSPYHRLSGILHPVVTPLIGRSRASARHNGDFIEKVRNLQLDVSGPMVSFDIKYHFPSVRNHLAVNVSCTLYGAKATEEEPSRSASLLVAAEFLFVKHILQVPRENLQASSRSDDGCIYFHHSRQLYDADTPGPRTCLFMHRNRRHSSAASPPTCLFLHRNRGHSPLHR